MAETSGILAWTLVSECPIPGDVNDLLVPGETAIAAYKTFRDAAIFTNKRLIVRDAQGFTGKKVEIYSLPYSSIFMWSSENGHGIFNVNSEIELWTKAGHMGSTPTPRTVVKGWRTSNPAWRSFAASSGCGTARCIRTHPLLPHRVSGTSCDRSVRA